MRRKMPNTHWIWVPDWKEYVDNEPTVVRFRKTLTLDACKESMKLKISADTRYKLYVNGTFVEFGPARGDARIWFVDEVEIAPYLHIGENVIAFEVLRYPLAYAAGNFGMCRTATPGLFVEEVNGGEKPFFAGGPNGGRPFPDEANDGEKPFFADESWKCKITKGRRIFNEGFGFAPLFYMEEYTADASDKNWKLAGYDDSDWLNAKPYNVMQVKSASTPMDLTPRPIPFLKKDHKRFLGLVERYDQDIMDTWNGMLAGQGSVCIPAGQTQIVEINAGEEMCGYLSLRVKGGAGAKIRIMCAECYVQENPDDPMHRVKKRDRTDWKNGFLRGYNDIYHVAGYGDDETEEVYEPFWFRTFRYVQMEITAGEEDCCVTGFDYLETGYPLEVKTKAEASDATFEGIWDISLRTLKRCMHETYEDCPFYEQLQYAMDSRNEILYTYMTSADDRLARQCMDDFRRSQRADGMINSCYPHWGPNVIPGFSIYYIMMVYDHMMFFGDKKLVRKHLGAIDQVLEFFDNHLAESGMVGKVGGLIFERYWGFIDWAEPWNRSMGTPPAGQRGPVTMESFLYIMGLQAAAALCRYVGRDSVAEEYLERAASVQAVINAICRDEEGFYLDGPGVREYSQHCQVFAVLTDTVSVEEGRALVLKTLEDKEKFAQCTVAAAFYLYRALEKVGAYEETDQIWDIWRDMVKMNLTTCVESPGDGRSDCHAWGSLLLYELPAVILGVRPAAPGFEKIAIAPVTGKLTWAKGEVATKWGMITVDWKKNEDGSLELHYEVPEEVKDKVEVTI